MKIYFISKYHMLYMCLYIVHDNFKTNDINHHECMVMLLLYKPLTVESFNNSTLNK